MIIGEGMYAAPDFDIVGKEVYAELLKGAEEGDEPMVGPSALGGDWEMDVCLRVLARAPQVRVSDSQSFHLPPPDDQSYVGTLIHTSYPNAPGGHYTCLRSEPDGLYHLDSLCPKSAAAPISRESVAGLLGGPGAHCFNVRRRQEYYPQRTSPLQEQGQGGDAPQPTATSQGHRSPSQGPGEKQAEHTQQPQTSTQRHSRLGGEQGRNAATEGQIQERGPGGNAPIPTAAPQVRRPPRKERVGHTTEPETPAQEPGRQGRSQGEEPNTPRLGGQRKSATVARKRWGIPSLR